MSENFEADMVNYREEILRLVAEGKIKHMTKFIEKASDETFGRAVGRNQRAYYQHTHRTAFRVFNVLGARRVSWKAMKFLKET